MNAGFIIKREESQGTVEQWFRLIAGQDKNLKESATENIPPVLIKTGKVEKVR